VEGVNVAVVKMLHDPENTVRGLAALALGETGDLDSIRSVLDAAFQPDATFQYTYRAVPDALKKSVAVERNAGPLKACWLVT